MAPHHSPSIDDQDQHHDLRYSINARGTFVNDSSLAYYSHAAPLTKMKAPSSCRRKCVTFYGQVTCHSVLHHNDYTDEEKRSCWYDGDEWRDIQQSIREAVSSMPNEIIEISASNKLARLDEFIAWRGLETRTRSKSRCKKERRLTVCKAIMNEQNQQWEGGVLDPIRIALVSDRLTYSSRVHARMVAAMDELAVSER